MSSDTEHTGQPSDDDEIDSCYDDLDGSAGCVEIWEHMQNHRND